MDGEGGGSPASEDGARFRVEQTLWCFWDAQVSVWTLCMGVVSWRGWRSPGAAGVAAPAHTGAETASVGKPVLCTAPLQGVLAAAVALPARLLESTLNLTGGSALPFHLLKPPCRAQRRNHPDQSREDRALTPQVQLTGAAFTS